MVVHAAFLQFPPELVGLDLNYGVQVVQDQEPAAANNQFKVAEQVRMLEKLLLLQQVIPTPFAQQVQEHVRQPAAEQKEVLHSCLEEQVQVL
jgi:hypothetical protein